MLVELTTLQGDPVFINPSHVIRTFADPDREHGTEGGTLLHFCDSTRQLVREPLREVVGLCNLNMKGIDAVLS